MASIFRGLTYYANGLIYVSQDREKSVNEINTLFNNTNVENGEFSYSTSSRRNRHSVAIIRYNDPLNFYKPAVEYVEDFNAIRKYGIKEIELSAFGCTSKGQATRLGRWALTSDTLETESVTFVAGLEAARLRPGDVFKVFDYNRKLKRHGGRALQLNNIDTTGAYVVLDGLIDLEPTVEYSISFVTPSYEYNSTQVTGLTSNDYSDIRRSFLQRFSFSGWQSQASGTRTILNLFSGFDTNNYYVSGYPAWSLELSNNYLSYTGARYFTNQNSDYYRLINIKESDVHKYEIEALQYNPQKYIEIESGLLFGRDIIQAPKIPATPRNLTFNVFNQGNYSLIDYSFLMDDNSNVDSYRVYINTGTYPNNNIPEPILLKANLPKNTTYGSYTANETGTYKFRIYSSNDINGILSPSYLAGNVTIYGNYTQAKNVTINSLKLTSAETGVNSGTYLNNYVTVINNNDSSPIFDWLPGYLNGGSDDTKYRVTVRPYSDSQSRIPNEPILYQETGLTDTQFEFSLYKNISSISGPHREYQLVVESHSSDGKTSAGNQIGTSPDEGWAMFPQGYDILSIQNPRQTGIEPSFNIDTRPFVDSGYFIHTGSHASKQFIGPNGNVGITFTSGDFDSDILGGYLYISSGKFPKFESALQSGEWATAVNKVRFDFDPNNPQIIHNNAAYNIRGAPYGYFSLSFYDSVDGAAIDLGQNISTGLYVSDNAIIHNDSTVSQVGIGGSVNLYAVKVNQFLDESYTTEIVNLIGPNSKLVAISNSPDNNWSSLIYIGPPLTGTSYPYTGIAGADGEILVS
jgi:hypothetical protein